MKTNERSFLFRLMAVLTSVFLLADAQIAALPETITETDAGAITASDALAILKIAVGKAPR